VTFGIEEEFVLLDPATLAAVPRGLAAVEQLAPYVGEVVREFYPSQVEYSSPILRTSDDALLALSSFRHALARWAASSGLLVGATGTPLHPESADGVHRDGRYARIARDTQAVSRDHQINGLHVHVAIPDRAAGVRAINAIRPWLPVLLAMSANSPFWAGVDTGFASWRAIHMRRWTTQPIPPHFPSVRAYDRALAGLTGVGATSDARTINWAARLSVRYPTVEVRICDAQLDPQSSTALAVIIRGLVGNARARRSALEFGLWDASLWHAARHGVTATLVDPATGAPAPAMKVIDGLRAVIAPGLDAADAQIVDEFVDHLAAAGSGAERQRHAHRQGVEGLAALLRAALSPAEDRRDAWAPAH
jgi:carboxylate-amine ligase